MEEGEEINGCKKCKQAKGTLEGSFPFIAFTDSYVIVPPTDVKLGKIAGALKFVNEVQDEQ